MRVEWNPKTIDWICSAGAYTGFPQALAGQLLEQIPPQHSVCDLGCGVGLVDLALAAGVRSVTGVDQSDPALDRLAALAAADGLRNLEVCCADVDSLVCRWDTAVTIFFGGGERLVDFLRLSRVQVLAVLQEGDTPSFGPCHPPKKNTVAHTVQVLERLGARYEVVRGALEYGQPFCSRGEAADFIHTYARGEQTGVEDYLDRALEPTGRSDYPWYLPQQKRFGIITLRRADNPELI